MKFITFKSNWADEMDVSGAKILSSKAWDRFLEFSDLAQFPISIGVGTNQEIDFYSKEEMLKDFKVFDITTEEEVVLDKYLGNEFGEMPLTQIVERITCCLAEEGRYSDRQAEQDEWFFEEL